MPELHKKDHSSQTSYETSGRTMTAGLFVKKDEISRFKPHTSGLAHILSKNFISYKDLIFLVISNYEHLEIWKW